ncbi:MAG: hypothetical protein AB7I27_11265 [Bacteriovoracaceae bacterium]
MKLWAIIISILLYSCDSQDKQKKSENENISPWSNEILVTPISPISAGVDQMIFLPQNFANLIGRTNLKVDSYKWSQISGSSAIIISPNSMNTKIKGLGQGRNVFRLTIQCEGQEFTDNVTIIVQPELSEFQPNESAGKISIWKREDETKLHAYNAAVFLPFDYGTMPYKDYHLILSLHGKGESIITKNLELVNNGDSFINQLWNSEIADQFPAIVIAPSNYSEDDWDHIALRLLVIEALSKYSINPDHIIIAANAEGSIAAQKLITYSKDLIDGAILGAYSPKIFGPNPCEAADIPIWVFGNSSDGVFVSHEWQKLENDINKCINTTYEFKLSVYTNDCGHGCWNDHWQKSDVIDWLTGQ